MPQDQHDKQQQAPINLEQLQRTLGLKFQDKNLLRMALTHSSHITGQHGSYERLEFLGDRVLGLLIADILYQSYPQEDEGKLSRRFVDLVRKEALIQIGQDMGLMPYIRLSRAEEKSSARSKANVLADVCEAILAAVYLDQGYSAAREFLLRYWQPYLQALRKPPRDPKTALQEWAQARQLPLPDYQEIDRDGPDHSPVFRVLVRVQGFLPQQGEGKSKRQAQQVAAFRLLEREAPEIKNVVLTDQDA